MTSSKSGGVDDDATGVRSALVAALQRRMDSITAGESTTNDLQVALTVLDELLEAARVFTPWREQPKLTIFGSARTKPSHVLYEMAEQLSREMATRGWITVSGAGPGIMEASAKGAGFGHTLGVNIDLPFEQNANPYIDAESRLVAMKYFFTRKVALTRESIAFVVFPGGLGTLDELFELLTLMHTGKSKPAPVVLVEEPGGSYWNQWLVFVHDAMMNSGYLDQKDACLFSLCQSVPAVISEIELFYSNYQSFTLDDVRGLLQLRTPPTPVQLSKAAEMFPMFNRVEGFRCDHSSLTFDFDGRNYVNLRLLIDEVNRWTP